MSDGYGWPPASTEIAETVDKRLSDVLGQANHETVRVAFRGEPLDLPVISMPIPQVYLNPNTHRVRAQRAIDARKDETLGSAPWSDDAQAYLEQLLKAKPSDPSQPDAEYVELLEELRRDGTDCRRRHDPHGGLGRRQHEMRGSSRTWRHRYPRRGAAPISGLGRRQSGGAANAAPP